MLPINCYLSKTLILSKKNKPFAIFPSRHSCVYPEDSLQVQEQFQESGSPPFICLLATSLSLWSSETFSLLLHPCSVSTIYCPESSHSPSPPSCSSTQILRKLPVPLRVPFLQFLADFTLSFFLSSSVECTVSLFDLETLRKRHTVPAMGFFLCSNSLRRPLLSTYFSSLHSHHLELYLRLWTLLLLNLSFHDFEKPVF